MSKYKKTFLILGFITIVFVIGYLLYILFFRPAPSAIVPPEEKPGILPTLPKALPGEPIIVTPEIPDKLPTSIKPLIKQPDKKAKGDITEIKDFIEHSSMKPQLAKNGSDIKYYNQEEGIFYRVNTNGDITALSSKVFHNVQNVTWSPVQNKAILEYPDGANIIYDFEKQKQITMPKHWEEFNFAPNGENIAMKSIGLDVNNRWLAITDSNGSNARRIESIGINADTVYPSWSPNNQTIAMYTKGIDFDRQEVFFVGLNDENFKSTVIHGRGFEPKWNKKGDKLLYSIYSSINDYKPMLWSVNAQGEAINSNRKNLNIDTWAHKCTFGKENNEIYCAVPRELQQGAGLAKELSKTTIDDLYKIDIHTGAKKLIAIPEKDYSMSNLIVSRDTNYLYFTDNATDKIKQIRLK